MVFSFYYTDKIALMVQSNNPIMQQINEVKQSKEEKSVNAIIEDYTIIPGKNGLVVNAEKSFSVMKSFGTFNAYYLVYDQTKPKISLEDNKDKIIMNGNLTEKKVSLILEYNENAISYFEKNKIQANVLVQQENVFKVNSLEKINHDFNNYEQLELALNSKKSNNNLCFVRNRTNLDFCKKKGKYLIDTNLNLTNDNIIQIKNEIRNGSIIYITKDTTNETINILLDYIHFKGYNIVYLSKLISEENK